MSPREKLVIAWQPSIIVLKTPTLRLFFLFHFLGDGLQ